MKRTLLIDADIVAYKFAAANEKVFYFDGADSDPSVEAEFEDAADAARDYIAQLRRDLGADHVIVCLTDPEANFRKDIWPDYKANRAGVRKPTYLMQVKDWLKENFETYQRPRLEADDCMGILATHPTLLKGERIMVSEDKDMQTIPGLLFNPAKDEEPRKVARLSADLFHLWQTIVGDTSDGYPGAAGVGPRSPEAQAVLASKSVEEAWGHVRAAFRRSRCAPPNAPEGEEVHRALVQARLARILRASDWDFRQKRPVLWMPPVGA